MNIELIRKLILGSWEDCLIAARMIAAHSKEEIVEFYDSVATKRITTGDERHLPSRGKWELIERSEFDSPDDFFYYEIDKYFYLSFTPGYSTAICYRPYRLNLKIITNE